MGIENNEAVLATTFSDEHMNKVRKWISDLENKRQQSLFAIVPALSNGKTTIILAPDGSKKGWEVANEIATLRDDFISLLESFDYGDGCNPFDWVEVGFGEFGQCILRGNCRNCYNDSPYYSPAEGRSNG